MTRNGLTQFVMRTDLEENLPNKVIKILTEDKDKYYTIRGLAIKVWQLPVEELNVSHRNLKKEHNQKIGRMSTCLKKLEQEGKIVKLEKQQVPSSPQRMNLYGIKE